MTPTTSAVRLDFADEMATEGGLIRRTGFREAIGRLEADFDVRDLCR